MISYFFCPSLVPLAELPALTQLDWLAVRSFRLSLARRGCFAPPAACPPGATHTSPLPGALRFTPARHAYFALCSFFTWCVRTRSSGAWSEDAWRSSDGYCEPRWLES